MHEISLPYFCTVCVLDISTPSMIVTTVIVMFYMTNCVISETVAGEDQVILGRNKLEPVMLNLIGLPKRGTYVVKEEIEKAPVHDHPCNLTETVVKISFPEMKSEVFINLLGYKGSNMIYLRRCKGQSSVVQANQDKEEEGEDDSQVFLDRRDSKRAAEGADT